MKTTVIDEEHLRPALDTVVRDSLRPVSLGLGGLYLVFAVSHWLLLPRPIARPMALVAAGTAITFFGLRALTRCWPVPPRAAHAAGVGMAGLVLANSLLHLYLTTEPRQTTNLLLLAVGLGFLLLSTRWLVAALAVTLVAWSLVVSVLPPSPAWTHFGFALLTASVLSTLVHLVRVRTLRRLETLRLRDALQKARLGKALTAVQWSERRLGTIIESAPEGILIVGAGGRIALVNSRIETLFGYDREELLGNPLGQLIPEALRAGHADLCTGYFRQPRVRPMGAGLELVARRKDGREFPVDVSLSSVQTADETLAVAFVADVTARKKAEQALQAYSEQLEDMVEARTEALREAQAQVLARQRLQQEVELAAEVQSGLLPRQLPALDGFAFAAAALPARYVSGDLYDFFATGQESLHIILADIAGKGVPAALLTSTARALLRAEMEHNDSPAAILSSVNGSLHGDLEHAEMFITCLDARLDGRTGHLTYASAGHNGPLWWQYRGRACHSLPATGVPVGVLADAVITEETLATRPGDVLVFYSDGISEAFDTGEKMFGLARLMDLVSTHAGLPSEDLCRTIVEAVEAFRGDAPRSDDMTLVVLKALPRRLTFDGPATPESLQEIAALVRQATAAYGDDFAHPLELAASEIATNVVKYAYPRSTGRLRGTITLALDHVQLDLYDDGVAFDPTSVPPPPLGEPREGGYGLFIARQMVDELDHAAVEPRGNHWRLLKHCEEGST